MGELVSVAVDQGAAISHRKLFSQHVRLAVLDSACVGGIVVENDDERRTRHNCQLQLRGTGEKPISASTRLVISWRTAGLQSGLAMESAPTAGGGSLGKNRRPGKAQHEGQAGLGGPGRLFLGGAPLPFLKACVSFNPTLTTTPSARRDVIHRSFKLLQPPPADNFSFLASDTHRTISRSLSKLQNGEPPAHVCARACGAWGREPRG